MAEAAGGPPRGLPRRRPDGAGAHASPRVGSSFRLRWGALPSPATAGEGSEVRAKSVPFDRVPLACHSGRGTGGEGSNANWI